MIEQKCENCIYFIDGIGEQNCCKNKNATISTPRVFIPKEELVRQDCIKDFETIIKNIHFEPNFKRDKENFVFDMAIIRYKEALIERLEKYLKEINKE